MKRTPRSWLVGGAFAALAAPAAALEFSFEYGDDSIDAVLNSTFTAGAAWRLENRADYLVGKANLNPDVCGGVYQACQGLFRTQSYPAERLTAAPGMFSPNFDDGNLNYNRGDIVQGVAKISQDLTINWGDYGFFARWLAFYDFTNADGFEEYHPNRITAENRDSLAQMNPPSLGPSGTFDQGSAAYLAGVAPVFPGGTFGRGAEVRNRREGGEMMRQAGTDFQLLDFNFFGFFPITEDYLLSFKLGRQTVNWGESTLFVFNSLNQANSLNANNFFRVGNQLEEVFTPLGMAFFTIEPFTNATIEAYYGYEWEAVEAQAPGTFFSGVDLGTNDLIDYASITFGGGPEDPDGVGAPQNNALAGVTPTSTTIRRLPDNEPKDGGQYGISFKYFAEELNNGTEFGVYYMNYHSRLPFVSVYATQASCARREGNALGIDANSPVTFLAACPDLPLVAALEGRDPRTATSDAVPLDTMRLQFEYPEDIHLFGVSFNTTVGDISLQGEVAYRPNLPMQVDTEDLVYAAFGPTLTRCHDPAIGCIGSGLGLTDDLANLLASVGIPAGVVDLLRIGGVGWNEDGTTQVYPPSDYILDGNGTPGGFNDTFDLLIGHADGSARSFPAFVTAYRGGVVGENPPCAAGLADEDYSPSMDCYIRGYERFDHLNFDLGAIYVAGATDPFNFIKADQVIFLGEVAASWIPDLPPLDQLQIDGPGTFTHASAGADGTGADRSAQACSYNPDGTVRESCTFGVDGLRFNPTQADLDNFTTDLAVAYALIALIKYESVLPGISIQPLVIWQHAVYGNAPGPGADQFMNEGRKTLAALVEIRYKSALSVNVGYTTFFGGSTHNLASDRDFAQLFLKYQF